MALEPLDGLLVVDLFAGSGALGIEALSRGARHAHFVERERGALAALETNLEALGLRDRTTIWKLDLERDLRPIRSVLAAADLVLLDPPYRKDLAAATVTVLAESKLLGTHARVIVEHHGKDVLPESIAGLKRTRQRRYGETVVSTYASAPG